MSTRGVGGRGSRVLHAIFGEGGEEYYWIQVTWILFNSLFFICYSCSL